MSLLTFSAPDPASVKLPLLRYAEAEAVFARHQGRTIQQWEYLQAVQALAKQLPSQPYLINLCECSYCFLVTFGAALLRSQTNLLPLSRAEQVLNEVSQLWQGSYIIGDAEVTRIILAPGRANPHFDVPLIDTDHIAAIGFTSGSTGIPQPHAKTWGGFANTTHNNRKALSVLLGDVAHFSILATVPPQHMYGIEMSVLMPLLAGATLGTRRDLFPADIAASLAELDEPRVLVSTPLHLRALARSGHKLPKMAAVVSATAPLSQTLANEIEMSLQTGVLELFGATETCIIASRRTAYEESWQLLDGLKVSPQPEYTHVNAPWFTHTAVLQDLIECLPDGKLRLHGRHADLIEIAGKRASLADLTRRLQGLEGVLDAVLVQEENRNSVQRLAALVVAPTRTTVDLLQEFRRCVDPVFLPRRIVKVDALPRNAVGKLPRQAVLEKLQKPAS